MICANIEVLQLQISFQKAKTNYQFLHHFFQILYKNKKAIFYSTVNKLQQPYTTYSTVNTFNYCNLLYIMPILNQTVS